MAKNVYRHGLSRGGYRKLEETMMNEKRLLKSKDDSTLTDDDTPPSPPDRHEKWTRARTKKGGGYTSEAVKKVAEKIVSKISKIHVIDIKCNRYKLLKIIACCRIILLKKQKRVPFYQMDVMIS
jgi:hypothetical protein